MAVNSVRNVKSAERIRDIIEILDAEKAKKNPKWREAVKRGVKSIEGVSARNFADAQTAFLATRFPERIETDLYEIAREVIAENS